MKPRDRIHQSLCHREPDRVGLDLGGTESSGLTAQALHTFLGHLKVRAPLKVFDTYQYVAFVPEAIAGRWQIDTVNLWPEPRNWVKKVHPNGFEVMLPETWCEEQMEDGSTVVRGRNGVVSARRPPGGHYFDSMNPLLADVAGPGDLAAHQDALFAFDWPSYADEPLADTRRRAEAMYATGKCVVFNLCCHLLAAGQLLRGYENFMTDLLVDEPLANALLSRLVEGYCLRAEKLAAELKDVVDVVLLNDDLGTQNGPMIAPSLYRKMIKPYQATLFGHVKKAFSKPILFHSCGAVSEFIPDLVEVGVDALNPVQISAAGMSPQRLKKEFGADVTFWGGGIDTQSVLNHATPAQVKDAVKRNVEIFAPGGGFVFCQVHNIQPDVPPENIEAMLDGFRETAGY